MVRAVAPDNGFVVAIDLETLKSALDRANGPAEITLLTSLGAYVAFHDPLADVRSPDPAVAARVATQIADAIHLEEERRLEQDPSYGIEQLTTIAWRSGSTSQQNPAPTLAAIHALRDILSRWTTPTAGDAPPAADRLPVVYPDDAVPGLLASLESLTVVASGSMRHQVLAEITRTLAIVFDRLPSDAQERA